MDIDVTFFIQLSLFALVLVALNRLLIGPLLQVLRARHQKILGTQEEATRLARLGTEDQAACDERLKQAYLRAQRDRESLRIQGRDRERTLLAEARADSARELNQARDALETAELEAQERLRADTDAIARMLVAKVLGREVAS